ncbi:hypothetical protein VNO80_23498 [Phaseolus coccineus]|uniref:RNase H type-1 domain-containing protein n=1 Tax=Phaseolus coccineus TaxID=3886 RepID=A0AAN9M9M7_PHACN
MSGSDDNGSSWTSRFLKVAGAAAATAAVAGGLIAALSSASANFQQEAAFGARREGAEREHGEPWSRMQANNNMGGGGTLVEKWEKPKIGWVKLNVDGSRDHYNGGSAGCGGVVRDSSGKWVGGFAKKLDSSLEVHRTELEAILAGLQFVSDMNFKKVVVESDNKSVVSMLENWVKRNHPDFDVIQEIMEMLHRFDWEVKLVAISNTANSVADRLAKNARTLSFDGLYQEYLVPPDNCVQFLQRDGCLSSF